MNVFSMLGVLFVIFTALMVAGTMYLGYLQWKEERATPAPPRPTTKKKPGPVEPPVAANDTREIRKAS